LLDVHPNISVKDKNGNDIFYHIEIEKFEAEEEENQSVLKYLTNLDQRLKRLI
jgi:hypothetical protein